jgi:hypothetical protein
MSGAELFLSLNCHKTHEKCSIPLAIKEVQIKTTLRFHFNPVTPPTTNVCKDEGKKEPSYTVDGNVS